MNREMLFSGKLVGHSPGQVALYEHKVLATDDRRKSVGEIIWAYSLARLPQVRLKTNMNLRDA